MSVRSYIAIIDDDESVCRSLGRLLQSVGMHPVCYTSAEDFLDDRMRVSFDCLVIDVQLGGISGLELHRRLTACQVRTPVIYITAQDDPAAREQAFEAGCVAYFRKTDPGGDVIAAIHQAIGKDQS